MIDDEKKAGKHHEEPEEMFWQDVGDLEQMKEDTKFFDEMKAGIGGPDQ